MIEASGEPPEGWREALDAFAEEPSLEEWDRLLEFVPAETAYTRVRHAVRYLEQKDVSANMLFRISSRGGIVPDALRLVDEGDVDPVTVLERADEAPETVRGSWYAIAARAHFARGDIFGVVRLLKRALEVCFEPSMVDIHARSIWDMADEEAREQIRPVWCPASSSLWSDE